MNHSKTTTEEPACCKTQEVELETAGATDTEPETETEPGCCSPSGRSCCSGN